MIKIDIKNFKDLIGKKTQVHKVAYHFKDNIDIKDKVVLIADFEFTTSYNIHEITLMKIKNGKIIDIWFEEFKVPSNDTIFSFEIKRPVRIPYGFNDDKNVLTKEKINELFKWIDDSSYFVAHNYVAELQCLFKLKFPNEKYNVKKMNCFNEDKIICTNKSFNNKYFKDSDVFNNGFSNENVSLSLDWVIQYKEQDKEFNLYNNRTREFINVNNLPSNFINSNTSVGIHNSLYDTIITYSSFLTLNEIDVC